MQELLFGNTVVKIRVIRVAILFLLTVNSFMNYLLQVNTNTASSYLPVVIQIIFAAGLVSLPDACYSFARTKKENNR